jgi:hypothetical protein
MQLQTFSSLLALAALTACAAPADPQVAKQDTSNCQLEYRVGSSIPSRNCTTLTDEQRAQQRRDMDELSHTIHRGATMPGGGTGGGGGG